MAGDELARGAKSKTFLPVRPEMVAEGVYAPKAQGSAVEEVVSHVDNSSLFAVKSKPAKRYRGQALSRFLLIERVAKGDESLIIIPDAFQTKSEVGRVYSIGPAAHLSKGLKEGDLVMFDRFAAVGAETELVVESGEKKTLLVVQDHDVILRLEEV